MCYRNVSNEDNKRVQEMLRMLREDLKQQQEEEDKQKSLVSARFRNTVMKYIYYRYQLRIRKRSYLFERRFSTSLNTIIMDSDF